MAAIVAPITAAVWEPIVPRRLACRNISAAAVVAVTGGVFRKEDSPRRLLRSTITAMLNDETIDETAGEQAVEIVIRVIATLLMAPTPLLPQDTDDQARAFAAKYFVPLVEAARRGPL